MYVYTYVFSPTHEVIPLQPQVAFCENVHERQRLLRQGMPTGTSLQSYMYINVNRDASFHGNRMTCTLTLRIVGANLARNKMSMLSRSISNMPLLLAVRAFWVDNESTAVQSKLSIQRVCVRVFLHVRMRVCVIFSTSRHP